MMIIGGRHHDKMIFGALACGVLLCASLDLTHNSSRTLNYSYMNIYISPVYT
jgi:hypothetical protein